MRVVVVSNMYPDSLHPSYGIFVKKFCDQLNDMDIVCKKCVMFKVDGKKRKVLRYLIFSITTVFCLLFSKYDLVYIHYASHSSIPVLLAQHLKSFKIYTNVHGSDVVPENILQEKLQKNTKSILRKSEKVIVPSQYFKEYVERKYSLDINKIYVYPSGGIDRNIFYPMMRDVDRVSTTPTFGMAGRISSGKGYSTYLNAIRIFLDKGGQGRFILYGAGDEQEKMDELINAMHLTNIIERKGLVPQDQLAAFYNSIDFFVFPTQRAGESLGLVALEAMACGTPVIASNYAAPAHYVVDGYNGYKFEIANAESLFECMWTCQRIFDDIEYEKIKAGALETADRYSSEKASKALEKILLV